MSCCGWRYVWNWTTVRFPRMHRTMAGRMCWINAGLLVFLFTHGCFSSLATAAANNTLESNQQIKDKDGDTLVSANNLFQLGFFSPEGTQRRYVGIWLNNTNGFWENQTVWVANREKPIVGNTGILSMRADGNLVVSNENGTVVWSTNTTASPQSNSWVAVLEDSGNLVVKEEASSGAVVWESFDHPCNTLLPGMKIGVNLRSGRSRMLTAWRNGSDPSPGIYKFGIDPQDPSQFFVWRGSVPYQRVIFWNGSTFNAFSGEPVSMWTENASVVRGYDEVYLAISPSPPGTLRSWLTIGPSAPFNELSLLTKYSNDGASATYTKLPCRRRDGGSRDGLCGLNSSCNDNQDPMCKCLPGYKPMSPADWNAGNWRDGCIPSVDLQCEYPNEYLTIKKAKFPLPYGPNYAKSATMCKQDCDGLNCGCKAYVWKQNPEDPLSSCYVWIEELRGIEEDADYDDGSGFLLPEVNIRVAPSLLSEEGRRCGFCGTSVIPYPLSTSPKCGDPNYNSFHCNSSTGLLYFRAPDGSSYLVSSINKESRTFVIKPQGIDLCWAGSAKRMDIRLNSSGPFHLSRNNTALLLNCSSTLENNSHLDCSSSSPCHPYIQQGGAPCFHSQTCCSYTTRGSESNKSHDIGVLDNQCASYASIISLNPFESTDKWHEGIQIEWDASQEPVCDSNNSCSYWPNTSCRTRNAKAERKRCLCNDNFLWSSLSMNCTPDGRIDNKSQVLTRRSTNKRLIPIITVVAAAGIVLVVIFAYYSWRRKKWRKVKQNKLLNIAPELLDSGDGIDNIDVPFIDFKYIIEATENFSNSNELGRGGFGLVYKGKLPEGQEIAVKRLSKWSGQGLEEFKTEILFIAKLQHRNLVRMLGYCIEEDEKMLIYEYMPNKSLDFFLFNPNRCALLDWEKRFNIILGIARGLLYLHQDSRLRIIHRDLKTSNILLDKDMNPKISDFGMARIFGGHQTQENTNRVVGTYGYISPEYAANGLYSVKSDVYSLGIIMLEIVSGKKNADFFKDEDATSLTTHAWQLWKEGREMELMDPSLSETCNETQVLKCVHLGLLCVQDNASDRPCMSSVLTMLDNETASLPLPNEPAFFRGCFSAQPRIRSSDRMPIFSNNEVTISTLKAR